MTIERFPNHQRVPNYPRMAWGEYLHPTSTALELALISIIRSLCILDLQPKYWDMLSRIFEFFDQNRMFFIPWSLLCDGNSLSSDGWKEFKSLSLFSQDFNFGDIGAERFDEMTRMVQILELLQILSKLNWAWLWNFRAFIMHLQPKATS